LVYLVPRAGISLARAFRSDVRQKVLAGHDPARGNRSSHAH